MLACSGRVSSIRERAEPFFPSSCCMQRIFLAMGEPHHMKSLDYSPALLVPKIVQYTFPVLFNMCGQTHRAPSFSGGAARRQSGLS